MMHGQTQIKQKGLLNKAKIIHKFIFSYLLKQNGFYWECETV